MASATESARRRRNSGTSNMSVPSYKIDGKLKVMSCAEANSPILCTKYSFDGKYIAFGCSNGDIKIFYTQSYNHVYTLTPDDNKKLPVTCIRFIPNESQDLYSLAATYSTGYVRFWYITSKQLGREVKEDVELFCCDFNCDFSKLAMGGDDYKIRVFDVETMTCKSLLSRGESFEKMDGHASRVFSVKYHPNNENVLLSAGWDNTVQIWDDREGHAVRRIFGAHVCGDALDMDPVYYHVLTGSWRRDDSLQVWDFDSGRLIKNVPIQNSNSTEKQVCHLYCAKWAGKDFIACGGSDVNTMKIIEKSSIQTVAAMDGLSRGCYTLDYAEINNTHHITCASGNNIYFMNLNV